MGDPLELARAWLALIALPPGEMGVGHDADKVADAVSALAVAQDAEITRLKAERDVLNDEIARLRVERDVLNDEIARLRVERDALYVEIERRDDAAWDRSR